MPAAYTSLTSPILGGRFATNSLAEFISVFPKPTGVTTLTDISSQYPDLSDDGAERDELGLAPEAVCEYRFKVEEPGEEARAAALLAFIEDQADKIIAAVDWSSLAAVAGITNYPGGDGTIEEHFAHRPQYLGPCALITSDPTRKANCIQTLRDMIAIAHEFHGTDPTTYYAPNQQRDLGWFLVALGWLAYFEANGHLTGTGTYYRDALEANRVAILALLAMNESFDNAIVPSVLKYNKGTFTRNQVEWRRSGWQQAFIAQANNQLKRFGFTTWQEVIDLHSQHWQLRAQNWGMQSVDYDYCEIEQAIYLYDQLATQGEKDAFDFWANIPLFEQDEPSGRISSQITNGPTPTNARANALLAVNWDSSLIVDNYINGQLMTWPARLDIVLSALGDHPYTPTLKLQRQARIDRGGAGDYESWRHSIEWRNVSAFPQWRATMSGNTWVEIPNTNMDQIDPKDDPSLNPNYPLSAPWDGTNGLAAIMQAWGGGCNDDSRIIVAGGGHQNSAINSIFDIELNTDNPQWRMSEPPSGALPGVIVLDDGQESTGVYSDGRYRSTHTYNSLAYKTDTNELIMGMQGGVYKGGTRSAETLKMIRFDGTTLVESGKSVTNNHTSGSGASGGGGCLDQSRNGYWWLDQGNSGKFSFYDFALDQWSEFSDPTLPSSVPPNFQSAALTRLPDHDLIFASIGGRVDETTQVNQAQIYDPSDDTWTVITFQGTAVGTFLAGDGQPRLVGNRIYWWNNHSDTEIINYVEIPANPKTGPWQISQLVNDPSNSVIPTVKQTNGTWGRFAYIPSLQGFALVNATDQNIFFYAIGN
tara:strand:- start:20689 stop:23136 length:2448 start_codon:yes stop_codon:yes gene_type:complete